MLHVLCGQVSYETITKMNNSWLTLAFIPESQHRLWHIFLFVFAAKSVYKVSNRVVIVHIFPQSLSFYACECKYFLQL